MDERLGTKLPSAQHHSLGEDLWTAQFLALDYTALDSPPLFLPHKECMNSITEKRHLSSLSKVNYDTGRRFAKSQPDPLRLP
jgi:hypothetical protein